MAALKQFGVITFQAEDEIAAVSAAVGASFGGALGVTATSGPGLALKAEAIGLAVATELPLVVVDVQRAGPSTGMPTKTEQSDLLQALFGRNGDAPVAVLAPATPGDCFDIAIEAVRIATRHMTPVIVLSDGYLANGAEPWRIPDVRVASSGSRSRFRDGPGGLHALRARRDDPRAGLGGARHARPRAPHRRPREELRDGQHLLRPGQPPAHDRRCAPRRSRGSPTPAPACVDLGDEDGDVAVVGWGSTYGAIHAAVGRLRARGGASPTCTCAT